MNKEEYYALAVDVEGKEVSLKVDKDGILKVPGNQKIQQLTTNAVKVFCRNNPLKLLEAPDAIYVGCNKNQLISLRVDNAEEVNCSENKLTELHAPKAKNVRCSFNKLTHLALENAIEIDCSGNSELKELIAPKARKVDCYVTKIEFEDVKEIDFSLKNSFERTTLENYDISELTIDVTLDFLEEVRIENLTFFITLQHENHYIYEDESDVEVFQTSLMSPGNNKHNQQKRIDDQIDLPLEKVNKYQVTLTVPIHTKKAENLLDIIKHALYDFPGLELEKYFEFFIKIHLNYELKDEKEYYKIYKIENPFFTGFF